jgi:hypothetical protein
VKQQTRPGNQKSGPNDCSLCSREWLDDHAAAPLFYITVQSRHILRIGLLFVEAPGKRGPARRAAVVALLLKVRPGAVQHIGVCQWDHF